MSTTATRLPLLDVHEFAQAAPPEAIPLPLDLIDPSPENPRAELPEVNILAASIQEFGLMQPIFVRRIGDRYQVLSGHRRRAACMLLGWGTIPAVVRSGIDDDRALRMLISSQLDTRAWKPREEAMLLERLMLSYGTLRQVGEALHRTESWASKRLRVYSDAVLSGYVQAGRLLASVAEELLPIKDAATRRQYAEQAAAEEWSQDQAKKNSRALRKDASPRRIAELTREMLDLLPVVDPKLLPLATTRDLWTLRGAIEVAARGGATVMPTIEQAERVAHVTPASKARADRQRQERQRANRKAKASRPSGARTSPAS